MPVLLLWCNQTGTWRRRHFTPLCWESVSVIPPPPFLLPLHRPLKQRGIFPPNFLVKACKTFSEEGGCPWMFANEYLGNHKLLDLANGFMVFGVQQLIVLWIYWFIANKGELVDWISPKVVILLENTILGYHHFWVVHSYSSFAFFASRPFYH